MKSFRFSLFLLLGFLTFGLSGCDAIGGIFKAGAYVGIIGVVLVVALAPFIGSKMRGGRGV